MGRMSQAGFVDEETGEKVRGSSFNYDVGKVLEVERECGFAILTQGMEGVRLEREVRGEDVGVGRSLGRRGKK